jgi:hypothetical protein
LVSDAWINYLTSHPYRPEISVLPDPWYAMSEEHRLEDKPNWTYYLLQNYSPYYDTKQALDRQYNLIDIMNIRHPLSHFPPSQQLWPWLKTHVIWDPANLNVSIAGLLQKYGSMQGQFLLRYFQNIGRKITIGDIIKPQGTWGFLMDWSVIGYEMTFEIPFDDSFFNLTFIQNNSWYEKRFVDKKGILGYEGAEWKERRIYDYIMRTHQFDGADAFNLRDDWIQYWIKGRIPFSYEPVVKAVRVSDFDRWRYVIHPIKDGLKALYPLKLKRKDVPYDYSGLTLWFTAVVSTFISFWVGGPGAAVATYAGFMLTMMAPAIKSIFSGLPEGLEVVMMSCYSAMINQVMRQGKAANKDEAKMKVVDALVKLGMAQAKATAASWGSQQNIDTAMAVDQIDSLMNDRQRNILEALLHLADRDAEDKINGLIDGEVDSPAPNKIVLATKIKRYETQTMKVAQPFMQIRPGIVAPNDEANKEIEKENKKTDWLLWSSLGLGAAAIAKHMKKK